MKLALDYKSLIIGLLIGICIMSLIGLAYSANQSHQQYLKQSKEVQAEIDQLQGKN